MILDSFPIFFLAIIFFFLNFLWTSFKQITSFIKAKHTFPKILLIHNSARFKSVINGTRAITKCHGESHSKCGTTKKGPWAGGMCEGNVSLKALRAVRHSLRVQRVRPNSSSKLSSVVDGVVVVDEINGPFSIKSWAEFRWRPVQTNPNPNPNPIPGLSHRTYAWEQQKWAQSQHLLDSSWRVSPRALEDPTNVVYSSLSRCCQGWVISGRLASREQGKNKLFLFPPTLNSSEYNFRLW